jgi:hypothetical protein
LLLIIPSCKLHISDARLIFPSCFGVFGSFFISFCCGFVIEKLRDAVGKLYFGEKFSAWFSFFIMQRGWEYKIPFFFIHSSHNALGHSCCCEEKELLKFIKPSFDLDWSRT